MAGNENSIVEYLFNKLNKIELKHLGVIKSIGNPDKNGEIQLLRSEKDLNSVKTQAALKKADIYLNDKGVSIKQSGGNFPYNRLQRAGIIPVLKRLNIKDLESIMNKFDDEVKKYHTGFRVDRNIHWQELFDEESFKKLLKYLMMDGYPTKESKFPAEFILEAPKVVKSDSSINVFTFEEYFATFKDKIVFSIRRQWIGQKSNSEHKRATGLAKIINNSNWVYKEIVGQPSGWRENFNEADRRSVYFLMIEKLK